MGNISVEYVSYEHLIVCFSPSTVRWFFFDLLFVIPFCGRDFEILLWALNHQAICGQSPTPMSALRSSILSRNPLHLSSLPSGGREPLAWLLHEVVSCPFTDKGAPLVPVLPSSWLCELCPLQTLSLSSSLSLCWHFRPSGKCSYSLTHTHTLSLFPCCNCVVVVLLNTHTHTHTLSLSLCCSLSLSLPLSLSRSPSFPVAIALWCFFLNTSVGQVPGAGEDHRGRHFLDRGWGSPPDACGAGKNG